MDQAKNADGPKRPPLVDYRVLAGRIAYVALGLGALTFIAIVVQGLQQGLTFALMARWAAVYGLLLLVSVAVLTATHAIGGATRAQRRGERLTGTDVRLRPSRRRHDDEDDIGGE